LRPYPKGRGLADSFEAVIILRPSVCADRRGEDGRINLGGFVGTVIALATRPSTRRIFAILFTGLASATFGLGVFLIRASRFAFDTLFTLFGRSAFFLSVHLLSLAASATAAIVPTTTLALFLIAVIIVGPALFLTLGTSFFLTRLVIGNHPEVVVCELEVILGLNTVAIVLRVLSKLLILVEQLRRITPRAAVDPVLVIAALVVAVSATAATIVTIVIQGKSSC
jgi:hypothetical protein